MVTEFLDDWMVWLSTNFCLLHFRTTNMYHAETDKFLLEKMNKMLRVISSFSFFRCEDKISDLFSHNVHFFVQHFVRQEGSNTATNLANPIVAKTRLMFPNLSMLDLSNNQLTEIPSNIYELNNLSVLNISGNAGKVTYRPPICFLQNIFGC